MEREGRFVVLSILTVKKREARLPFSGGGKLFTTPSFHATSFFNPFETAGVHFPSQIYVLLHAPKSRSVMQARGLPECIDHITGMKPDWLRIK